MAGDLFNRVLRDVPNKIQETASTKGAELKVPLAEPKGLPKMDNVNSQKLPDATARRKPTGH